MSRARGFTLLEVMVVVVIVGILSALLAPNFVGGSRERELRREASALAAIIRLAQDEAMLYGQEYGIVAEGDRYFFVVWDPAKHRFRALATQEASWAAHPLPEGMTVDITPDAGEPLLAPPPAEAGGEVPAPGATAEMPAADAPGSGEEEPAWQPIAFVLSSGEVTPFTAVFRAEGTGAPATLRLDPLGNRIEDEEGADAAVPAG